MIFSKIILGDSRKMVEIEDETVDLVVTSPPYWHIKDYQIEGQIGYGQTLHEYLKDLFLVWKECYRVLKPGSRLCINVGDQFLRSVTYGSYKVVPLHSEMIVQGEKIGFDYMGSIIWQKKTTMNTTGGAPIMGSYPYPPNGMIEIDYEFILIFKKPGKKPAPPEEIKRKSILKKEEWKEYFSGHWKIPGEKKALHEAMFPLEIPKRLIKMFSFVGDTVLDPFLGSGTTIKAAIELERNSIGYEINENYLPIIKKKINLDNALNLFNVKIDIIKRTQTLKIEEQIDYIPNIKDAKPLCNGKITNKEKKYVIKRIIDTNTLEVDNGLKVKLLGIKIVKPIEALNYLEKYVKGKKAYLKFDPHYETNQNSVSAYVFLKNKIFINKEMLKMGFAVVQDEPFIYRDKFLQIMAQRDKNV